MIQEVKLFDREEFEISYEKYRTLGFLSNIVLEAIPTSRRLDVKKYDTIPLYPNVLENGSLFY